MENLREKEAWIRDRAPTRRRRGIAAEKGCRPLNPRIRRSAKSLRSAKIEAKFLEAFFLSLANLRVRLPVYAGRFFGHPVYDDVNVCTNGNAVTITSVGIERAICPYFRVVRTNGSGSYFDALRTVHAMSYAGGVRRRNFARPSRTGDPPPPASLEGTRNEVDGDRVNLSARLRPI